MKKALIALSVAAGMIGAAQAENTTTLYGSLGVETQVSKASNQGTRHAVSENEWNLDTQTAKIGVKVEEDLANGLQAFGKFEFDFTSGNGLSQTRYAYIGLKSDAFGTLTFGKQDSLYKVVTNYNDIFENNYWGETVNYGVATGGSRIPKVISYVSPNWAGFQFGLAGILDGSRELTATNTTGQTVASDSRDFTAAQAGLWYNQYGFYAGIAYSWLDFDGNSTFSHFSGPGGVGGRAIYNDGATEVWGGAVGYSNDTFKVGLGAQKASSLGEKYNLAGEYYMGPNTFRAGVGMADSTDVGYTYLDNRGRLKNDKVYTYALGYQYNFSKRTYTYVEGEYIDWNDPDTDNGYTVRVGLRHNF